MVCSYFKPAIIVTAIMSAFISFGQVKEFTAPNFVNPFQSRKAPAKTQVIAPGTNTRTTNFYQPSPKIEIVNGSFYANLEKQNLTKETALRNFNSWFGVNSQHSFQFVSEKTDELGVTHTNYRQLYKGFPVEGSIVMVHAKNNLIQTVNGQVATFSEIETEIRISNEEAKSIAKDHLAVTELVNEYPVEIVIATIPSTDRAQTKLTYKVRIDSYSPLTMYNVYIDATSGEIINMVNLISYVDVPGTGTTLYSGTQSITCDDFGSGYRLRESGRKIETYDATNATGLNTSGFIGASDFTNSSTAWSTIPQLSSFTISTVEQSWWYSLFTDETPDLYIVLKDGANQTVFTSAYISNTNPSLTYNNLNVRLTNPPYTVEIWDHDAVGGDDFGESYSISTTTGTQSWSGNGNNGTYLIDDTPNPALDVHWGMEMTYDFYLNVLSRDSYDGSGSIIKQYLNPPPSVVESAFGETAGLPNNAFAAPPPYNIMVYGMGDGIYMNPLVGIDVEGHEFSHMVVNHNGNGGLAYQGESGALNESFADIFGTCIEFYSGVNPDWTIGEGIMIGHPYMRSMSDPNSGQPQQPDTYQGNHWANPENLSYDKGGVHVNSGVQNYWFYLLSEGGSGTNDLGNPYSVTGIGIDEAAEIAYRNLITYLGPNATFYDAYNGSLQAAEDLFGNPSAQYTAVREAWYAVGIGNAPNSYCSGTTNLTASTGTITDGSGAADYNDNANCKWVIAPAGATQISLDFTYFDTESNFDTVFVYDGPNDTYPLLLTWWGNTLPTTVTTTPGNGSMCVKFKSDVNTTAGGWSADYTSTGISPTCEGGTVLSDPSGGLNDGSGGGNYGNNQLCYWFISPPCATSVTLSFSQFNTEQNYDGVVIYDDLSGSNQLAALTGTTIPGPVTSTTGKMLVVFVSDYSTTMQGFTASYNSVGSAHCSGVTTLNTADYGTFSDGSGVSNYCNNLDCQWLIQPPLATTVTLNFTAFDLEPASPDGHTIYDAVEVYDGTTTGAPLLGAFTGDNLPPAVTSSGGSMLVRFYSDVEVNEPGWSAYYTSTQNPYCSGTTNLTASSGTFSDGSAANDYSNNSDCSWLIQPTNASSITLSFSAFDTELNYDGIIVYDGADNMSPVLGQFTGTTIPSPVISTGGSMYVEFLSDPAIRSGGWTANYTSTTATALGEDLIKQRLSVFPNPTDGSFIIRSDFKGSLTVQLLDILGQQVLEEYSINEGDNEIDATDLSKGVYLIRFKIGEGYYVERLVIN